VTVYRGAQKANGKLIKVKKTPCDPSVIIKASCKKFYIKKSKGLILLDLTGLPFTKSTVLTSEAGSELFLRREDEFLSQATHPASAANAGMGLLGSVDLSNKTTLPAEIWQRILVYTPASFELLRSSAVSLTFHRNIVKCFGCGFLREDTREDRFYIDMPDGVQGPYTSKDIQAWVSARKAIILAGTQNQHQKHFIKHEHATRISK
jgi:hypothetical protein